jgi:hypothetical protein
LLFIVSFIAPISGDYVDIATAKLPGIDNKLKNIPWEVGYI